MSSQPATLPTFLKSIDADKATLDAARPLSPQAVASLRDALVREWAGHARAIEGGAPTQHETRAVLECITIDGTPLRAHLDATHHRDAIGYVEDIVSKREALSERQIRNLHRLVLNRIGDGEVRRYRQENVAIAGASTVPPGFLDLPADMAALIGWYREAGGLHPVVRAAELHARLLKIHPFVDGNGRTARLMLAFELMKDGYPPAIIRDEDRPAYHDALDRACAGGEFDDIARVVAEAVRRALHLYLDVLGLRYAAQPDADHFPNHSNGEPTCPLPPPPR